MTGSFLDPERSMVRFICLPVESRVFEAITDAIAVGELQSTIRAMSRSLSSIRLARLGDLAFVLNPLAARFAMIDRPRDTVCFEEGGAALLEAGGGIAEVGAGHFFNSSPAFISVGRRVILQQLQVI